jgi:hypothetical protein
MNRRDTLKYLLTGSVISGFMFIPGCSDETKKVLLDKGWGDTGYGRTPEEIAHDTRLMSETFFTDTERKKIDILVDIVVPADEVSGSATDAGVPDFIEFMMKDFPGFQNRMRGGLMWLDHECRARFNQDFLSCNAAQRLQIIDDIAYPDEADEKLNYAVRFFTSLRNLTVTGFYTTAIGFEDLGYVGNRANNWDGVPDEVLRKYGLKHDPKYADVYIKHDQNRIVAKWDDDGNLIG